MSLNTTRLIAELRTYARSLCRNKIESDAIIKEALEKAIHSFNEIPNENSLRRYLFRTIRNRYYGNITRRKTDDEDFEKYPISLYNCALGEDSRSIGRGFGQAIQQLPVHCREAIVLMLVLDQTLDSSAAIMECDVGTAAYRLDRALRMLQVQALSSNTST